jgi:hypothetical protein
MPRLAVSTAVLYTPGFTVEIILIIPLNLFSYRPVFVRTAPLCPTSISFSVLFSPPLFLFILFYPVTVLFFVFQRLYLFFSILLRFLVYILLSFSIPLWTASMAKSVQRLAMGWTNQGPEFEPR